MIRDPDVQEELGICVETAKVGVEVSTWKSFFLFFFLKKFFFLFFYCFSFIFFLGKVSL